MENITLSETEENFENMKEELKLMILNEGMAWGEGRDMNDNITPWCLDSKAFLLNPRGLYLAIQLFMDKIKKYNPDAVGGLTLASHLIASSICFSSLVLEKYDAFLVRRERKEYNMGKLIEGPSIENKNVVIIDDGLNAAGYAQQAIKAVEGVGCKVLAIIILINFERNDNAYLKKQGYIVENIFTLNELGLDAKHIPSNADMYELKWRYPGINKSDYAAPKSSPAVEENRIYVGSDQGKLLCFDFSGKLVWEFETDYNPHGVHQTPVIVDEKVIFSAYDGGVYALNREDGSLIWKNNASSYSGSSPIYDKETNSIFVGCENSTLKGTMVALDANTGISKWEFQTNNHVPCRAAISESKVVFGSNDCFIYACDKNTGKLIWKYRTNGDVKGRITVDGNLVYATSFDGNLYCLDSFGKLIWKRRLGEILYNAPLIYNDKVFVGSYSNQLTALDKKSGKVLWYFKTTGHIQSYPIADNGIIYFGSYDGNVYALDSDGSLLWTFITGGPISSSPTIFKNKLFVSSNESYLYCFGKNL